ncbi:DUF1446 domain-containing protein [Pelagibacterales bacterium]|nr:DUF1446 domain-containing protein [Pelagibacterales bacterium]
MNKSIKIGGASGFWGDSFIATSQLLNNDNKLDFIVYDYLAEITMSILARARTKDSKHGYAIDFVTSVMKMNLRQISDQKVKIISNAGGVNPEACADAIRDLINEQGLNLKVAVVVGDDLLENKSNIFNSDISEMFTGDKLPDQNNVVSINAYLGAFPIAEALRHGADIVITGRCVDSAVTLGACIYSFDWKEEDWNHLSGGSLAGHIIECGTQSTGGNFTDWELISDQIDTMGYPIVKIFKDSSFNCMKSNNTGGLVSVGTITEQLVYEIGDPQAYILPDVVCDFSQVKISQINKDTVKVSGAIGYPSTNQYKVSMTYSDGFRGGHLMSFVGIDAGKKAKAYGEAIFKRSSDILKKINMPDFTETSIEVLGDQSQYSKKDKNFSSREVILKYAGKHSDIKAIGIMLKESVGLALSTPPGLSGFAGARPKPSPVVRLFSFLIKKSEIDAKVLIDDKSFDINIFQGNTFDYSKIERPSEIECNNEEDLVDVPLIRIAYARSGDKGNKANIGIIARDAKFYPAICKYLDNKTVSENFSNFQNGSTERYLLPGSYAVNFLLDDILGGGGAASLRNDPQGKAYGQILLDQIIPVSKKLLN